MNLEEILALLARFEASDLTGLKVQLQGDLFEATREELRKSADPKTVSPTVMKNTEPMKVFKEEGALEEPMAKDHGLEITAPMVGTFYRRPGEGEAPFVEEGDLVEKGQVLCILEAMKVMNELKSPAKGRVKRIYPVDGEGVDFGKVLMVLEE